MDNAAGRGVYDPGAIMIDWILFILIIGGGILLQAVILPRLGIGT